MKSVLRFVVIPAVACLALAALAAGKPDEVDGAALFKQRCSMCHGQDGKGISFMKTPDYTDPKWQAGITDDQIVSTIKNGKPDTAMKPYGGGAELKDDEIQALLKQIRAFGGDNGGSDNKKKKK
jgi:mono/diheme cytochrome c family protein